VDHLSAHGGVTYSDFIKASDCQCDLPIDEMGWWIGFDCGHYMDYIPFMKASYPDADKSQYRDFNYVLTECKNLADQMAVLDGWPHSFHIAGPDEVICWCEENINNEWAFIEEFSAIGLKDDRDVFLFKLRWFNTES
jgi:hypothetical protein